MAVAETNFTFDESIGGQPAGPTDRVRGSWLVEESEDV